MEKIFILIFITFASVSSNEVSEWGHYGYYSSMESCEAEQELLLKEHGQENIFGCLEIDIKKDFNQDDREPMTKGMKKVNGDRSMRGQKIQTKFI